MDGSFSVEWVDLSEVVPYQILELPELQP